MNAIEARQNMNGCYNYSQLSEIMSRLDELNVPYYLTPIGHVTCKHSKEVIVCHRLQYCNNVILECVWRHPTEEDRLISRRFYDGSEPKDWEILKERLA